VIQFIQFVGRLGRMGGVVFLLLAAGFAAAGLRLSWETLPQDRYTEVVWWSPASWMFAGLFGFAGLYLVVTGGIWKRDSRFQPMSSEQLVAAVQNAAVPFCVCLDCMLFLPYEVSVGRCPRCESSGSCLEVHNGADRKTALNAIPPGR